MIVPRWRPTSTCCRGLRVPHWRPDAARVATQEINEIKADDVLSKCGPPERLLNRRVEVDRTACVPTVLTRVISLGVWQWCPANVSWAADVTAPAPAPQPTASTSPPPAPEREILSYRPSQ